MDSPSIRGRWIGPKTDAIYIIYVRMIINALWGL